MESAEQLVEVANILIRARGNIHGAQQQYERADHLSEGLSEGFIPWSRRIRQTLYITFVASFLLACSTGTYALFYVALMPSWFVTKPLYFDYTGTVPTLKPDAQSESCFGGLNRNKNITGFPPWTGEATPRHSKKGSESNVDNSKLSEYPVADVDLFAKHISWEAFHDDVVPPPNTKTRLLSAGQAYSFELALVIPENEKNRNGGVFGVSCELRSGDDSLTLLARSNRSTILPYESNWVGNLRKAVLIVPLLVGAVSETRTVVIPSFRHFVESTKYPLQHVKVRILSPRKSSSDPHTIEVMSGEIRIGKELNVLQNLLREWFYTFSLIGVGVCFTVYTFVWVIFETWLEERRQRQQPVSQDPDEFAYGQEFHEAQQFAQELPPQQWEHFRDGGWDGDSWEPTAPEEERQHDAPRSSPRDSAEGSTTTTGSFRRDDPSTISID